MLLGMGTSFLTSKGLDSIDKRFNVLGNLSKPTVEVEIDAGDVAKNVDVVDGEIINGLDIIDGKVDGNFLCLVQGLIQ